MPLVSILSLPQALKRNWQIVGISMFVLGVVGSLGVFFFMQGRTIMDQELRERLKTMAAISALQFHAEDLDEFHTLTDIDKPIYATVIRQMRAIRKQSSDIIFIYILRPLDEDSYEFVADADSLYAVAQEDLNNDGMIDDSDQPAPPGTPYDVSNFPSIKRALFGPTTIDEPFTDQWGTHMSGFAPILNSKGKAVAIIGIDMDAQRYVNLSHRILSPLIVLLVLVAALLLSSLVAYYMWRRRMESLQRLDHDRTGLLLLALHQLGTPLAIIQWSLEELQETSGKVTPQEAIAVHARQTGEAVNQLDTILDEMKEASEVEVGTVDYHREWTALHNVIQSVATKLDPLVKKRKQTLQLNLDSSLRLPIDRKLIGGVLRELLLNAITFSPDGGTVTVTARKDVKSALVEISDHGCGISANDREHLFEKFTRGENAHVHQPNGNGLGLFISKGIIERAGGKLWVKSIEGKGTTVFFTLPA